VSTSRPIEKVLVVVIPMPHSHSQNPIATRKSPSLISQSFMIVNRKQG